MQNAVPTIHPSDIEIYIQYKQCRLKTIQELIGRAEFNFIATKYFIEFAIRFRISMFSLRENCSKLREKNVSMNQQK